MTWRSRWIGRIAVAVVLLGLGWYACGPGPRFKEWPGSAAVTSPDGTLTAQVVFRQYRRGFSTTSEPGDGFESLLRVNAQEHRPRWGAFFGHSPYGKSPCSLAWESASRIRIDHHGRHAGYGFVLGTCVRMVDTRDLHFVQDPVAPLPDALRARLLALGRPEREISALGCVRVDQRFEGAVVSERENVLLILGGNFRSHNPVVARGPVLVEGEGYPAEVGTSSWAFFDGRSGIALRVDAAETYVGRDAHVRPEASNRPPVRVP